MGLGAWWLAIATGALWRRTLWRERGEVLRAVQQALGGDLRATWAGFELKSPVGRIRWRGGVRGPRTVVVTDRGREAAAEWLDEAGIRARL